MPSKPDFVFYIDKENQDPPEWKDVELLFEHTRSSQEAVTSKFSQWLRCAWSVFHHQPFRRHLYGIMFINPCAYICYVDHGCAVYSEALYFTGNKKHAEQLIQFLSVFIAMPEYRGRDPTVQQKGSLAYIQHAKKEWYEVSEVPLWYRPCLTGRHIRVAKVRELGVEPPHNWVMKSTWEEKIPPDSSPPSEVEVLRILLDAGVRGLPQPYCLDDSHLEVETGSFPEGCEVAFPVTTKDSMAKMRNNFISSQTSKTLVPAATGRKSDRELVKRIKLDRDEFNQPMETTRRLTRVIMSYCTPLREAMRNATPKSFMQTIRDSMIVYYEAYKRPKSGFLHGGKCFINIL